MALGLERCMASVSTRRCYSWEGRGTGWKVLHNAILSPASRQARWMTFSTPASPWTSFPTPTRRPLIPRATFSQSQCLSKRRKQTGLVPTGHSQTTTRVSPASGRGSWQSTDDPNGEADNATGSPSRGPRARRTYLYVSCAFALLISADLTMLWINTQSQEPYIPGDEEDPSAVYEASEDAGGLFDKGVEGTERWTGIIRLRKELLGKARGNVLEACCGTGRNGEYYDFEVREGMATTGNLVGGTGHGTEDEDEDEQSTRRRKVEKAKRWAQGRRPARQVDSVDFSDQSAPMLRVAREKWEKRFPGSSVWFGPGAEASTAAAAETETEPEKTTLQQQKRQPSPTTTTPIPTSSSGDPKIRFLSGPTSTLPNTNPTDPTDDPSGRKYDTIIQTFGLCSLAHPLDHLHTLASLLRPTSPSPSSPHLPSSYSPPISQSPSPPPPSQKVPPEDSSRLLLLEHGRTHPTTTIPYLSTIPFLSEFINSILDRESRSHARKWGCWWNRDIPKIVGEAERRGWLVVEECRPVWYQAGTVWVIVARRGDRAGEGLGQKVEGAEGRKDGGAEKDEGGKWAWWKRW